MLWKRLETHNLLGSAIGWATPKLDYLQQVQSMAPTARETNNSTVFSQLVASGFHLSDYSAGGGCGGGNGARAVSFLKFVVAG